MTMSRTLSLEPSPFHLNLKWKKQFCFPRTHHTLTSSISIPNNIKSQNNAAIKFKFKCHLNQNHKTPSSSSSITSNSKPKSLLESLATTIWNTFRKPAVAALILFLLTTYNPNTSLAASGGRMGGRAFSKSSSSTSTSYSSPSSSSSSSSSGSYSSPSSSSSSSSWSYSAPSRRSRSPSPDFSYSRSYWDKPSSSKSYWDEPSPSPSRVEPPSQPSPEFSYSSSESSPSRVEPAVVDSKFDAVLFLICVGFLALILVSAFLSDRHEERSVPTAAAAGKTTVPKLQQNQAISDPDEGRSVPTAAGITTILKLQVGLLGTGRSLQRDLNRIAEVADTSSPEGLNYILTETSLALIRHPDYCISGYSSVDIKQGIEEGEERFNQLSIEERGKFDEETLVNVDNIKRQSTRSQRSDGCSNEYIVITILAAAEGEHKLPSINGSGNLKEALQKLGSIPSSKLLAVEVLWTPQDENDTLLEQELLEDYPLLQPF